MRPKRLIVVAGATATGKTAESIRIAKLLSTEIVSSDSRQFYKEMNIGVARPSHEELQSVPHHLIAHISVKQKYNVAMYEQEALRQIEDIFRSKDDVVLAGGSGLYIKAVCEGIDDIPEADESIRAELNELFATRGIEPLQQELKAKDPEYYSLVDKCNHIRLIRALEVCRATGKTFSSFRKQDKAQRKFEIVKIGIRRKRENLLERIYKRVDLMMEQGLLAEVESLLPLRDYPALNSVGYKELFEYLDGKTTLSQAVENIKINTRRYAKRQMTWFCKDKEIQWFDAEKELQWNWLLR
ncbi:MAG: tRNA (adenosine(37)-N6)-dimethylallyltransferase MiaA [Bacteroidales bacterium]|nr:tRNA (adenosine(37)-N6)-dimethylallyltransferase MiaA [Bacteroidales bacterium]